MSTQPPSQPPAQPGAGGRPRKHKPRTRAAALRVGLDQVRERNADLRSRVADQREAIGARLWEAVADKPLPKARPATMLRDLFGTAPARPSTTKAKSAGKSAGKSGGAGGRGGGQRGPDTKAAAAALGVSQRTVQRWVKDGLPKGKSPAADKLRADWAASKKARARQVSPQRKQRLRDQASGLSVTMKGRFIVSGDDRSAGSTRTVQIADLTPDGRQALLDALLDGDSDGAYQALIAGVQRGFGGSVDLDIDLDALDITW